MVKDLASAKKSRASARMWVTKAVDGLKGLLAQEQPKVHDLEHGLAALTQRLETLSDSQAAVEDYLPEEELQVDIDDASRFLDGAFGAQIEASQKLKQLVKLEEDSGSEHGSCVSNQSVQLPKLSLPEFGGDLTQWQTFWDKFKATVDGSDLPDVTKFTYLQSLLVGDAKKAVEGLSLTSAHYKVACELLQRQFERREKIVFSHIQGLLNLTANVKGSRLAQLQSIQDQILVHVRSLEALEVNGETYGIVLTPLVLSRLPPEVRMEWAREGEGKECDLQHLLDFLEKEIARRERAESLQFRSNDKPEEKRRPHPRYPSASALQTSSESKCGFCDKPHPTAKCFAVAKLTRKQREQKIRDCRLCLRCLSSEHFARGCPARCEQCQGKHHVFCCHKSKGSETDVVASPDVVVDSHVGVAGTLKCELKQVVLQTAKVKVLGPRGTCDVTLLFDSGSDRTYVSNKLVKKLGLKRIGATELRYAVFGGGQSSSSLRNVCEINMQGVREGMSKVSLKAVEIPVICAPMARPQISANILSAFTDIELTESGVNHKGEVSVDVLVGLDYYWQLMGEGNRRFPNSNLVAQQTVFGWVVSGSLDGDCHSVVSQQLLCLNDLSENTVRRFWDLESIGIGSQELVAPTDKVLEDFDKSIQFKDGRYEVGLPWKQGSQVPKLKDNRSQAQVRLQSLSRKLSRDPSLKSRYDSVLQEMECSKVIEEVPPSELVSHYPVFYLPHRPVVKEASSSTKVRPVFDASAKGVSGVSLNDCLETGPSLNPCLVELLVRFRRWRVAITADLTKAFLQIKLQRKDQDVHRFLWDVNGSVRVMRFLRVTFGNKASPFLLNATIRHHLGKYPESVVVRELRENLYVDDWLSGADTEEEACSMFQEAKSIMSQAGMSLAKWNSNSKVLVDKVCGESGSISREDEGVKVLGVMWNPAKDSFSFEGVGLPSSIVTTKRVVLSFIARMFDPVGFLTPFTLMAKCLFQCLWQLGLDWDQAVPEEISSSFCGWLSGLELLKSWQIPRCYCPVPWNELKGIELHCFGDASEKGYGAVVYLRFCHPDGTFSTAFVTSKARVAPLKKVTLPRLELLGSLLAARLLNFVRLALKLPEGTLYRCWTDSTAALGWIKGSPYKWKQFVANRVSEIQELTSPSCWFHCPGQENPADLTTRGVDARTLVNSSLWVNGPHWLSGPKEEFPKGCPGRSSGVSLTIASEVALVCGPVELPVKVFEVERWGTFSKAIRVVSWVLRFVSNVRRGKEGRVFSQLSYEELSKAKLVLFRQSQRQAFHVELKLLEAGKPVPKGSSLFKLSPFVDPEGVLRVSGRLQFAELSYEEKHPLILPKDYLSKLLVRFQHRLLKHAGVDLMLTSLRNSFWIVGLRRIAKGVKGECVRCQRQDAKSCNEVAAPLPESRVSQAPPFTVTGVDFAGPLFCVDRPGQKLYICLFTCAVVRAVHLELTESLSTSDFVLAFERFVARRGLPSIVYSDNAKTFKGAEVRLQALFGPSCPSWKYIVPRSPWWGGWWERLVRSVKGALRKSLGRASLSRVELETTLFGVENCINSRPLTFVSDEVQSKAPLTPNHFLTARGG